MASHRYTLDRIALAAAGVCALAGLGPAPAQAQSEAPSQAPSQAPSEAAASVVIVGRGLSAAGVAGFGAAAPARTPLQASVYGQQALADGGITTLGGLTRLDASIGDAYNAEGYWAILSARGYTLDNRYNYRRDGLPINAETTLALDNKDRLEVLKGTSGIQAGTSAPGGLVNLVVKRPTGRVRSATLEARQAGSVLGALDLADRWGVDGQIGLRLNVAAERLDPPQRRTQGDRRLLALAADWQVAPGTLLQAEAETSHRRQASVAGFSLLGDKVPAASRIDPRINLNDQPWRQPGVFDADTASLRWQQQLSPDWHLTVHAMQQRLRSDDRTAFPYGVYDAATYACLYCDRFAPDGTFTYWEFISDNERRTSTAVQAMLAGTVRTGRVTHRIEGGVLRSRYQARFQDQVFDIAGTGRIDGGLVTPPSFGGIDANTNRDEASTEVFVRDAMQLGLQWQLWAGLRHSRLDRAAERTRVDSEGTLRATRFERGVHTPWLAVSWQWQPRTMLYASWGKGLETDVAPNRSRYGNAGQSLLLASRQAEAGLKHGTEQVEAALTLFSIDRGQTADIGPCDADSTCTRTVDGSSRHRGIEGQGAFKAGAWTWQASAMWLQAQRRGSSQPGIDGTRPTNVPKATLRLGTEYAVAQVPGLAVLASLAAESNRVVLPYDTGVTIPGWARIDLGARWRQAVGTTSVTWRVAVDNAAGRRAWKESPYQFSHVYLYPLPPRTWRGSVQLAF